MKDLVVQQPGGIIVYVRVTAKLQGRDPSIGLADEIERQKPGVQREFSGLFDRAGRKGGLMAAATALVMLEPPAIDQPLIMALETRTPEPIGPAGLLQGSLTLLLCAVQPLELRQGKYLLELDATA